MVTLVRHAWRVLKITYLEETAFPENVKDVKVIQRQCFALLLRGSPTASAWTVTMMGFLYLQSRMSFGGGGGVETTWDNSQLGDLILSETMWNPSERSEQLRNWWKACPSAITFGQSAPCLKNVTTSNISPAVSLKLLTVTYVFEICVDKSR